MAKTSKSYSRFLRSTWRFHGCNGGAAPRSQEGVRQFHEYESTGKGPESPDPYFLRLRDGKAWWEWTLNSYKDAYLKLDSSLWPGWYALARDFLDDPEGFVQLRKRLGSSPLTPAQYLAQEDGSFFPAEAEQSFSSQEVGSFLRLANKQKPLESSTQMENQEEAGLLPAVIENTARPGRPDVTQDEADLADLAGMEMNVRVIVAGTSRETGLPSFFGCTVRCDGKDYLESWHQAEAMRRAMEGPDLVGHFLAWDEEDGPAWLFDQVFAAAAQGTDVETAADLDATPVEALESELDATSLPEDVASTLADTATQWRRDADALKEKYGADTGRVWKDMASVLDGAARKCQKVARRYGL